jgi:hypothetical protein
MLRMLTVCLIMLRNKSFRCAGASGTVSDAPVPAVQFQTCRCQRYSFRRAGASGTVSDVPVPAVQFQTRRCQRYSFRRAGASGTVAHVECF